MNHNQAVFIGREQAKGDNMERDYRTLFWIETMLWAVLITLAIW